MPEQRRHLRGPPAAPAGRHRGRRRGGDRGAARAAPSRGRAGGDHAARARAPLRPPSLVRRRAVRPRRPRPVDLAALARDQGAELVRGTLEAVDPDAASSCSAAAASWATTSSSSRSARSRSPPCRAPSPSRGPARPPRSPRCSTASRSGELRRLVFAVPGATTWSLPVYELAMMAAADLRARGVETATLGIVTPSPSRSGSSAERPAPRCARCSTRAASRSGRAPGRSQLRDGLLCRSSPARHCAPTR